MANLLQTGAAWLATQLSNHASVAVTLRRSGKTGSCNATIGQTLFESTGDNEATTLIRSRDFLIPIADYVIGVETTEPQRHDVITATIAGVSKQHKVLEDATGRCFRLDEQGTRYRIHTKEVG